MARGSAPGERRGGRQAGTPNRKTHALREAIEAEGVDPAVALVRIGKEAEAREDYGLAVEAYGKVVGFLHARPKPVEVDPAALVELERELIRAKLEETARALKSDDTLADRLARAKARRLAGEVFEVFDAMVDASAPSAPMIAAQPVPPASAGAAPREPAPTPEPEPETVYSPILPRGASDWSAPAAPWPERRRFVDEGSTFEREPYGGFLDAYKPDF